MKHFNNRAQVTPASNLFRAKSETSWKQLLYNVSWNKMTCPVLYNQHGKKLFNNSTRKSVLHQEFLIEQRTQLLVKDKIKVTMIKLNMK